MTENVIDDGLLFCGLSIKADRTYAAERFSKRLPDAWKLWCESACNMLYIFIELDVL